MVIHFKTYRSRISALMIISFIVSFLGGKDAITTTTLYNNLDLENKFVFRILEKYNKKRSDFFPDLNVKGELYHIGDTIEVKVGKGYFNQCAVGQDVTLYKTTANDYMTEYQIKNQKFIQINGYSFSFVFIPTFIFLFIGLISFCFLFIKKPETTM